MSGGPQSRSTAANSLVTSFGLAASQAYAVAPVSLQSAASLSVCLAANATRMPPRVKSLANDPLKPSPAPTINAVLYFMVSMNSLHFAITANLSPRAILNRVAPATGPLILKNTSSGRLACPLWVVKSGHVQCNRPCPFYPRKRHQTRHSEMSAVGQKRTFCNAAETGTIRSPHRRGTAVIVTERLRGLKIEERHANRRTSDLVGRCYRHHRHRNWLCRQIGDERDGLWTASATRKRGTRLVAGQGVRDIVPGVLLIVAIITARADLWWLMLVFSLIPLGDALVVLTNGGSKSAAFGIHGATAAAMIIAALLLERS